MKKIPTIFNRDPKNNFQITTECNNDCLWVFHGEGIATRKYDGTCCKIDDGILYKRREIKKGKQEPEGFVLEDYDNNTGKKVGWIKCDRNDKSDKYHWQGFDEFAKIVPIENGTYELVGPKIQGNPEGLSFHFLIQHSIAQVYENVPRYFKELKEYLEPLDIEGIVFHHPDGRMAKIKKKDFGLKRK